MRAILVGLLFLAGCVTPSTQTQFVYLDSDSYCCGAAEGLGCGLAIAPVLEKIDRVEGVLESATSWDGRHFRVTLLPGASRNSVTAQARDILAGDAMSTVEPRSTASSDPADKWFNAQQTIELSRYEAGVLAADFAARIEAEVTLSPAVVDRLRVILREELERAFERAHAAGGGVRRLYEQAPAVMPRLETRTAEILTPEQRKQVARILTAELAS